MSNATEIAETILRQLCRRNIRAIIGAKNILALGNGVAFQHMPGVSPSGKKVNYTEIVLDPSDTYTMRVGKKGKFLVEWTYEISGLYAEGLQRVFEQQTGLYLTI